MERTTVLGVPGLFLSLPGGVVILAAVAFDRHLRGDFSGFGCLATVLGVETRPFGDGVAGPAAPATSSAMDDCVSPVTRNELLDVDIGGSFSIYRQQLVKGIPRKVKRMAATVCHAARLTPRGSLVVHSEPGRRMSHSLVPEGSVPSKEASRSHHASLCPSIRGASRSGIFRFEAAMSEDNGCIGKPRPLSMPQSMGQRRRARPVLPLV